MRYFFLSLFVLFTISLSAQSKTDKAILTKLDAAFEKALKDFNVPGMAIAIVKDDQVIFNKGYGVKNAKTGEAVTPNTSFAIASNTKAFTAAALAILVDEGKIKWTDKVRKYLPYFQLYSPYVSEELTIRDLLCHRTGLATFSGDLIWYGTSHSREEVIRRAKYLEPVYGFRETYGYSNIMFLAAGEIIPAVTGQSWDDFIKERFFTPLNMPFANTSIKQFKRGQDISAPHNEVNGVNTPIDYVDWDNIGPAGSINASTTDVVQWIRLQLGKGTLDGKKYWSEARTWEMWENITPKNVSKWQRENMPTRHFNGYGLGWELMEYGGEKVVSHGGGYDGVMHSGNSKPSLAPEAYAGVYASEMYGEVEVKFENGNYSIDFKPTALFKGRLVHWQYETFTLEWTTQMMLPSGTATFVQDAEGKVNELRIIVENPDFDFSELKLYKK
jgi:CubicO group peptidase (beta-lactamase class C family)